ncbi:MAG: RagB/SusD family nutrient uptake outer membrane protein, partial [Bacteroidota bacterium]
KMKNILKYMGVLLLVTGTFLACSEDFLDGPAQGVLDSGTLANEDGIEATLIASYSLLDGFAAFGGWGAAGSNWIFGSVASDDAYKGSEPGDQQPTTDVEFYQWNTGGADNYLNDKFRIVYEGVSRTNATLNLLSSVEGIPAETAQRIEGESKMLRAHYHFEAYKYWGNIPIYTETDTDFRKSNGGTEAALAAIISDLDDAISLLPTSQAQVGRSTSWTAKAYKGRVLMFAKDFSGAQAVLSDVVNNGPYALEDCFHDIFSAFHDNGPETVFAFQASSNDSDPNGENGNRNDRLNFPHGGSPFGCCGFHQPSQNLVNAFKVDANGLPFLDGSFNDSDVTAADAVDPRLDWTAGRDDVPFLDWGLHAPGWIRDRAWAGPYSPKKNIYEKGSGVGSAVGWASYQLHSMNMHILRFADVMLMSAEAEVEIGNLETARGLVNQIRTRAGVCAQGADGVSVETTIDDPAITWANYQIGTYDSPWTDQGIARTAVRMERRLELAMEGHRFFDLRRWGTFKEVLNAYTAVEKERRNYLTGANQVEDRHQWYPLPTRQLELSNVEGTQMLQQNTGW